MKKILSVFICMALLVSCMAAMCVTADAATSDPRYTVLLLDKSSSMDSNGRITAEKAAAELFCETVINAGGSDYIAIVTFGTYAYKECDFTNDLDTLSATIESISPQGSTNLSDALKTADSLLKEVESSGKSIQRNIVICSDGIAQYGDWSYEGAYTYADSYFYDYANAALAFDNTLKPTTDIYTIGFFQGLSASNATFAPRFMKDLANKRSVVVDDSDALIQEFATVAEKIVEVDTPDTPDTVVTTTTTTASTSIQNPTNAAAVAQAIQTGDSTVAFAGIAILGLAAFSVMAFTAKRKESDEK